MLLGLLILSAVALGILISAVGPTVPAIAARLHARESDLGVVFGTTYIMSSLATPIIGRLYDALGPRVLFPLGQTLAACGALGEGFSPSLPSLAAAGALAGLGIGICSICNNLTATALFPERGESVLNLLNAMFGAGAFLGPLIARFALLQAGDYAPVFASCAALLAISVPLMVMALPPRVDTHRERAPLRVALAEPLLWAHAGLAFVYLGAEIGFGGWIVAILQHSARLSPTSAAPIASLYWLSLALGGVPTALLMRRGMAAPAIVLINAAVATAAAVLLLAGSGVVPLAALAAAWLGLSFSPIYPLNIAAALRMIGARTPQAIGAVGSVVLTAGQLGAATLPPLQGQLLRFGSPPAIGIVCVYGLIMLGLQHTIMRLEPS